MAGNIVPYIPEFITVHIGLPDASAENVTVPFADYIKNVASSEVYPTWEPAALRANILAQISFALNRVYTEHYAARGYPFQITSTTNFDQKFIPGRNIFDTVSVLVDDVFDSYIRRRGFVEPLPARFCNGTTSTCGGLSQWGSQSMAEAGADSITILRRYYGDVEIVTNAPIQSVTASYPGSPLRLGSSGADVEAVQFSLNRISRDYPAIPKIQPVDGIFGEMTLAAVKKFQQIFSLTQDGVVGKGTWYQIIRIYVGVKRLAELESEGQSFFASNFRYPDAITVGDRGGKVSQLQYMLAITSEFSDEVPFVTEDGIFGAETQQAVLSFQRLDGLPETGIVDEPTWNALYSVLVGVERVVASAEGPVLRYPGTPLTLGQVDPQTGGER
ncbi:MAG: peptidoglycan-binding protein [Oscillospiraceae bacterium]